MNPDLRLIFLKDQRDAVRRDMRAALANGEAEKYERLAAAEEKLWSESFEITKNKEN